MDMFDVHKFCVVAEKLPVDAADKFRGLEEKKNG